MSINIKNTYRSREAAEYIGMSDSFLRQSRMNGNREGKTPAPAYIRVNRTILYRKEDLDAWLLSFRIQMQERVKDE